MHQRASGLVGLTRKNKRNGQNKRPSGKTNAGKNGNDGENIPNGGHIESSESIRMIGKD
jgi:hypothetical protein